MWDRGGVECGTCEVGGGENVGRVRENVGQGWSGMWDM